MPTASSSATRLSALAIGSEVPAGDFAFRVHSLFGSAVNLAVADRRGLLALVGEAADDYPHGIRLSTRERFDTWPLAAGTPGRREGGRLVFEVPDGGEPLVVDLTLAVTRRRQSPPFIDPGAAALREAWSVCAFHLDGLQAEKEADLRLAALCGQSAPPTTLGEHLAEAARELAAGIRAGDAGAAGSAAGRLLGLGTGLTPSGDDFLCGLLAALWCASAGVAPSGASCSSGAPSSRRGCRTRTRSARLSWRARSRDASRRSSSGSPPRWLGLRRDTRTRARAGRWTSCARWATARGWTPRRASCSGFGSGPGRK